MKIQISVVDCSGIDRKSFSYTRGMIDLHRDIDPLSDLRRMSRSLHGTFKPPEITVLPLGDGRLLLSRVVD